VIADVKMFLVVQNFSKALKIGFISFDLSIALKKAVVRLKTFPLALFKNHR